MGASATLMPAPPTNGLNSEMTLRGGEPGAPLLLPLAAPNVPGRGGRVGYRMSDDGPRMKDELYREARYLSVNREPRTCAAAREQG